MTRSGRDRHAGCRWLAALAACLICFELPADELPALERKVAINGRVSLLVPSSFTVMSPEMLARKYPSANPPSLAYTNPQGTINVALGHMLQPLTPEQLATGLDQIKAGLASVHPAATWFGSELREINKRTWFVLDLRTPLPDTNVRNIMAGTSLDGRLLIVTFNVTEAHEKEWVPVGKRIIESIIVDPAPQ